MPNRGLVMAVVAVFLAVLLVPFWSGLSRGDADVVPALDVGTDATECVRDAAWMRGSHMDLLEAWQNDVVRGWGDPFVTLPDGTQRPKSLTRTCIGCHTNQAGFCDRCHDAMGVRANCWECHNLPGES